jgi:hypothetical protein
MTEASDEHAAKPAPPPPPPAELLPALAAFERGDWVAASAAASGLLSHPEPAVQAAARQVLDRMAPDPWAIRAGLLSLALLAIIAVTYVR